MPVTYQKLVDDGLLSEFVTGRYGPWRNLEGLNSRLAGKSKTLENHATTLLTCLDGDLEQAVIRALCAGVGADYSNGLRLISGRQFNHDTNLDTHLSIDIVIASTVDAMGNICSDKERRAVVAIEAKFSAAINAEWGYCELEPDGYSNQLICYTHGCQFESFDEKTVYAWLAVPKNGVFTFRGAITERYTDPRIQAALPKQQEAMSKWKTVSWSLVYDTILAELGDTEECAALLRGLGSGTGAASKSPTPENGLDGLVEEPPGVPARDRKGAGSV